jgi:hypothetical protein
MARLRVEVEAVDLAQARDAREALLAERRLALEGVEDNALEEVAEGDVVELGEAFEDLEEALFEADAGLDALDDELGRGFAIGHPDLCTMLPRYAGQFR